MSNILTDQTSSSNIEKQNINEPPMNRINSDQTPYIKVIDRRRVKKKSSCLSSCSLHRACREKGAVDSNVE